MGATKPGEKAGDPISTAYMILGSLLMGLLGATMRGDWIIIVVHFIMQRRAEQSPAGESNTTLSDNDSFMASIHMQNVHWLILISMTVSYMSFYGFGGWLTWYFYVKQKDTPENWKCQPNRWLTPENERHELLMGSLNMALGSIVSGIIAAWIINGGYHCMYFSPSEYSVPYLLVSTVLFFLMQDAMAYYFHRAFHLPKWYKHLHKHHHRYHSPTIWSATAMHPAEFLILQFALVAPVFVVPIYSGSFIMLLLYNYYYGMVDHSGIMMDAIWPWQPHSIFHDNHHKYFHTNFGFNTKLWDWLHDTLRKDDREYGEDVFYGRGKQTEKTK